MTSEDKETTILDATAEFRTAATRYVESAASPSASRFTQLAEQVRESADALRGLGADGDAVLRALMTDEMPAVRVWAAFHMRTVCPDDARSTIQDVHDAATPGFLKMFTADLLFRWRLGVL